MRIVAFVNILALFVNPIARADDVPRMEPVPGGVFINDAGMARLNGELADYQKQIAALSVENATLKTETEAMAAKPALTWKAVAILVGAGLVGGVVIGVLATR